MTTLLVDGDNLLTIGFYGVKNYFYKGIHIGGIYHFLNTLRKSFETYKLDKIVVFWDGEESTTERRKLYYHYKTGRKKYRTDEEDKCYNYERNRVKLYIEELYVRQGEYQYCESDDCIAYYVQNVINENIIIYSSDRDLTQLLKDNVVIYNPSHNKVYKSGDCFLYDKEEILIDNVKIVKIICGDPSDNISGISGLGIKRLIELYPEIKTKLVTMDDINNKFNTIFEQGKNNKTVKNLLTGVTKHGVLGDEFFRINRKIIELDNPFLTDIAKNDIKSLINDKLDVEGRSYKNAMKLMMEDGIFNILSKYGSNWTNFINPFLRLTRKEKNK